MKNYKYFFSWVLLSLMSLGCLHSQVDVTFRVNMLNETVSNNGVHLAGSIQSWNPSATPMLDANADGIYEVTITTAGNSSHQFKFINGNDWSQVESVPQSCGVNDGFGGFNRNLVLGNSDTTLNIVCFSSCENCLPIVPQDSVNVTFRVNMANQTVSNNGVHIAGSIQGWSPSTTPMLDTDGDDIYEVTISAVSGTNYQFKFINGNEWPLAELVPQSCGVSDGFSGFNRGLALGANDTILDVLCFGACENCLPLVPQDSVNLTFRVNMSNQTVSANGVHLAGSFQGWNPSSTAMVDPDGDDIYEVTISAVSETNYQYKFINGNDWPQAESVPQVCGVSDGVNAFNRLVDLGNNDTTLSVVCFGECEDCTFEVPLDSVYVTFSVNMLNQIVSTAGVHLVGSIQGWNTSSTPMSDDDNDGIYQVTVQGVAGATYQYKFINGTTYQFAELVPQTCGVDDGFGGYNRSLTLAMGDTALSPVCFASCQNCATPIPQDTINVTFKVNMAGVQVSSLGLHLAGNIQGWNPGSTLMTDNNNDDIYEVTLPGIAGQTYQFKFINGNDWIAQEGVPASCGVSNCCNGFDREISLDSVDYTFGPVCFGSCENCPTLPGQDTVNVTVKVNMNNEVVSANGVHVAGNLIGWNASNNLMTDTDNDGIYEYSFSAPASSQVQFKFVNGNSWSFGEIVPALCGINSGNGTFNRVINLDSANVVYGPVCFGECENCLDSAQSDNIVLVTFKVNMAGINVNSSGVHLAGSIQGWNPSSTEMLDPDGDGIYEVTLSTQAGTTHQFKFINGNDWSQAEAVPSSCGVGDPFGTFNRELVLGNTDFTYGPLCFGTCSNCEAPDLVDVTFQVNMSGQNINPTGVHIAGSFQGWNPSASEMTDANNDGVFEITLPVAANASYQYKYINGNDWSAVESVPQNCGVNDGNNGFNRELTVDSADVLLSPVCFSSCDICLPQDSVEVTFSVNMQNEIVAAQGVFLRIESSAILIPMTLTQASVYEVALALDAGSSISYRFVNGLMDEVVQGSCVIDSYRIINTSFSNQVLPTVCFGACADCGNNLITLQVNMREQQFAPNAVFAAGNFSEWALVPMTDFDQDSIYTLHVQANAFANLVYKFVNGSNWEFVPEACGLSDGSNVNRVLETGEYDVEAPTVCFGGCDDCASSPVNTDTINVTFKVNMENEIVSADGVHLAGNIQGWDPATTLMTDMDGDGIYEVTLPAASGQTIEFKFINGMDWGNAELVPPFCGLNDGNGGYNRYMLPNANSNVFGPVCFSNCLNCGDTLAPTDSVSITFLVNMNNITVDPNGVHLAGNIQGWSPSATEMTDTDADGIYEVILNAPMYSEVLFKFINGNDWLQSEMVPANCGADDGFGSFNRQIFVPTTDIVFGPICFAECADCNGGNGGDGVDVTFQVNMSNQTVSAMGVHLAGSMQGWDPAATEMLDADGDNIYSVTLNVPVNSELNYKFINGNDWPMAELVPGACGIADGFGGFNRQYIVANSALTIPTVCFGECADCGGSSNVNVTFNVNMSNQTVSSLGVHLAGNVQGWDPTATEMLDNDGDGIYSVTLSVPVNTNIMYKFINGNDWPDSEIVPAECGIDDGFGAFNRSFPVASNDINIQAVCFAGCSDCSSSGFVDVTFRVNIANIDLDSAGAFIAGSFNSFAPAAMNAESDSVYAYTTSVAVNSLVQFKFLNGANGWESVPFECGVDDAQGGYNRQISVDESNIELNPICFATCNDCGSVLVDEPHLTETGISVYPNPTSGLIWVRNDTGLAEEISIKDLAGRTVYKSVIYPRLQSLELNDLTNGIYHLSIGDKFTFRVVKF